jgi:threonine/homoserine/homoserine lactone efflux protein
VGVGPFDDLFQALLAGFVCGFVVCIPVGPVNLTVIRYALRRGFLPAFLVGLGAASADTIYATTLLAGHTAILDIPIVRDAMRIVALVVIVVVGIRSLVFKEEKVEARDEAKAERVEERWHHPRAFLLGFILTISNLMLIVLWATLAAFLFARDWVQPDLSSRSMFSTGVLCGSAFWFLLLSFFVSRAHRRVAPRTLTILVRTCGVVFLLFAALLAYRLVVPATKPPHGVDLIRRAT